MDVYLMLEKFANYILHPSLSELKRINECMVDLPKRTITNEDKHRIYKIIITILKQKPQYFLIALIVMFPFGVYYLGISYFGLTSATAFQTSVIAFATLIGTYIATIATKR